MAGKIISVGILSGKEIGFFFGESVPAGLATSSGDAYGSGTSGDAVLGSGTSCLSAYGARTVRQQESSIQTAAWQDGRILYQDKLYEELSFDESAFSLCGVTIGVNFHWERQETQSFAGRLRIIVEGDLLTAVNDIDIEDYLQSVISSEMKATASLEFLKAHAVISRSWLLAQIENRGKAASGVSRDEFVDDGERFIRWQDREDHANFDVCADDHCQRYQGLARIAGNPRAREAVKATAGEILIYDGRVCDARFSKCCGGHSEIFSTCWEGVEVPYLESIHDAPAVGGRDFCDTSDETVLSQVLNDYDLETKDFYRWTVEYDSASLSGLIRSRSGIDFGEKILALEPVERGVSGRIKLLSIKGTARQMIVGKELTIRKWLSESHLKSSDFDIVKEGGKFVLRGRGWGHGVGLCQIGAAVMGHQGYSYREILRHYFPSVEIGYICDIQSPNI